VVHGGEEDFACAAFLGFARPGKELDVGQTSSAVGGAAPRAVGGGLGIDGDDDELAAEALGQLAARGSAGAGLR